MSDNFLNYIYFNVDEKDARIFDAFSILESIIHEYEAELDRFKPSEPIQERRIPVQSDETKDIDDDHLIAQATLKGPLDSSAFLSLYVIDESNNPIPFNKKFEDSYKYGVSLNFYQRGIKIKTAFPDVFVNEHAYGLEDLKAGKESSFAAAMLFGLIIDTWHIKITPLSYTDDLIKNADYIPIFRSIMGLRSSYDPLAKGRSEYIEGFNYFINNFTNLIPEGEKTVGQAKFTKTLMVEQTKKKKRYGLAYRPKKAHRGYYLIDTLNEDFGNLSINWDENSPLNAFKDHLKLYQHIKLFIIAGFLNENLFNLGRRLLEWEQIKGDFERSMQRLYLLDGIQFFSDAEKFMSANKSQYTKFSTIPEKSYKTLSGEVFIQTEENRENVRLPLSFYLQDQYSKVNPMQHKGIQFKNIKGFYQDIKFLETGATDGETMLVCQDLYFGGRGFPPFADGGLVLTSAKENLSLLSKDESTRKLSGITLYELLSSQLDQYEDREAYFSASGSELEFELEDINYPNLDSILSTMGSRSMYVHEIKPVNAVKIFRELMIFKNAVNALAACLFLNKKSKDKFKELISPSVLIDTKKFDFRIVVKLPLKHRVDKFKSIPLSLAVYFNEFMPIDLGGRIVVDTVFSENNDIKGRIYGYKGKQIYSAGLYDFNASDQQLYNLDYILFFFENLIKIRKIKAGSDNIKIRSAAGVQDPIFLTCTGSMKKQRHNTKESIIHYVVMPMIIR